MLYGIINKRFGDNGMLKKLKDHYVNICIALMYAVIACLVYGIWSYSAWERWYVTFIIVVAIVVVSAVIAYFWIKSEDQAKTVNNEIENSKEEDQ